MILISHQTKSVVTGYRDDIAALFPHGKRFRWNGDDLIAVPHGIDETRLLRNLDLPVPAPIVEHYAFPSADGKRPFAKQVLTAAQMIMNSHNYVLNGMGTGKTKACLWSFDYLQSEGLVHRMLVVAPLSTLDFTWAREIFRTRPTPEGDRAQWQCRPASQAAVAEGRHLHHQPRRREGDPARAAAASRHRRDLLRQEAAAYREMRGRYGQDGAQAGGETQISGA
jgi:hypothetical protein